MTSTIKILSLIALGMVCAPAFSASPEDRCTSDLAAAAPADSCERALAAPLDESALHDHLRSLSYFALNEVQNPNQPSSARAALSADLDRKLLELAHRSQRSIKEIRQRLFQEKQRTLFAATAPHCQVAPRADLPRELVQLPDRFVFEREVSKYFAGSIAYSPDGRFLISGHGRGGVAVWERSSGKFLLLIGQHENSVSSVAFSPDGTALASGSDDGDFKIFDPTDFSMIKSFSTGGKIKSLAFSRDSRSLLIVDSLNGLILLDVANASSGPTFLMDGDVAALSSQGSLAVSRRDGIWLWDESPAGRGPSDQTPVRLPRKLPDVPPGPVLALAFSPDGKKIAASTKTGSLGLWDVDNDELRKIWEPYPLVPKGQARVEALVFSPNGKRLASGGDFGVKIWETEDPTVVQKVPDEGYHAGTLVFSPDGEQLAVGGSYLRVFKKIEVSAIRWGERDE